MYDFKIITSLVIRDKKGKFLLGKRSIGEDVFPGLWSIPGGKVERSPRQLNILENNVQKEVMEEFGITVEVNRYVQSHNDGKDKIYIIFEGHIIKGKPMALEDTEEVKWFDFKDLTREMLCPEVYDILRKVKVYKGD